MLTLNSPTELREYAALPAASIISDITLQVYLDQANLILADNALDTLDAPRPKLIELNLAAHITTKTLEKGGITQLKVGESEERYAQPNDKLFGLASTSYGQQAILLDTTGTLGKLTAGYAKARFEVYG